MATNEPVVVSIGAEPLQNIPAAVLRHSILRRTARPVTFVDSWTPAGGWHPLMSHAPKTIRNGTAFALWRWLVPQLGHEKICYLDSDIVVLSDIGELWDSLPEGKTIAAVCDAVGVFGKKVPEPNHVQTSVMVIDSAKLKDRVRVAMRACEVGRMAYRDLMQATWLPREEVHNLPWYWNAFGLAPEGTKLLHHSHVASQPARHPEHPTADIWWDELRDAVEQGTITIDEVAAEVKIGHVAPIYLKRLEKAA